MMTPAEQNIAIAEACGWKAENCWHPCNCLDEYHSEGHWLDSELPSYTTDLNAMHEAEKVLGDKWMPYARKLLEITTGCGDNMPLGFLNGATLCSAVHATAAQRAEAFLKTIGKWKE